MAHEADKFNFLQHRLAQIISKQENLQQDIQQLQKEFESLTQQQNDVAKEIIAEPIQPIITEKVEIPMATIPAAEVKPPVIAATIPSYNYYAPPPPKNKSSLDIEKFIGENLISKIGILILIIGVGIGVKYAIDNDLMSPMVRIMFGYLCSFALMGTAVKLKKKYNSFSAVLFSGGIATAYFTTYFASITYGFIPREAAFPIMVLMTVGTVFAAAWYKQEVIAHIGLWGAYAVPVLLSDGSNKTELLYSYMLIINIGMVIIAFKRDWKFIFLNAFISTWCIFFFASFIDFHEGRAAQQDLFFATLFFLLFFITTNVGDWIRKEKNFVIETVVFLMNALIYIAIGNTLVYLIHDNNDLNGTFLFANAGIYALAAIICYIRNSRATFFQTNSVLAVLLLTVAIPFEASGMQIPMFWSLIILGLYLLKRYTKLPFFNNIIFPMFLAVLVASYIGWGTVVYDVTALWQPIANLQFLWSVLLIGCLIATYLFIKKDKQHEELTKSSFTSALFYMAGTILMLVLYSTFLFEIIATFRMEYLASENTYTYLTEEKVAGNNDSYPIWNRVITVTAIVWTVIYTLAFYIILSLANIFYTCKKSLFNIQQPILAFVTFIFVVVGLSAAYKLDMHYIGPQYPDIYPANSMWINLRYVLFAAFIGTLFTQWLYIKKDYVGNTYKQTLELIFHFLVIIMISHELMHWSYIGHIEKIDKYGLSVFWAMYALFLVGYGIWKKKSTYRISGIVLLAITIVKLFVYDTPKLGTLQKFFLFLALGGLMLIISFLYNKYKDVIGGDKNV